MIEIGRGIEVSTTSDSHRVIRVLESVPPALAGGIKLSHPLTRMVLTRSLSLPVLTSVRMGRLFLTLRHFESQNPAFTIHQEFRRENETDFSSVAVSIRYFPWPHSARWPDARRM